MVLGLDVGTSYTKAILFSDKIEKKLVVKTAFKPRQAIEMIKSHLQGYDKIVATGYGRELVENADKIITEITAFGKGAYYVEPKVRTIIDIGGQDSKIIKVSNGKVDRFVMNDRCAAGTGNFIEKIAQSMNLTLEEFGKLAVKSDRPEMIDSLCVVMAESEILSLIEQGKSQEDIAAGICDSLIRRIRSVGAQVGIEAPILFCGGGALNPGLVKSMRRILGEIIVSPEAQFIGAIGAALSI
ncbi:MAG: acyl-CoA dehydratase activase [candidate division WOR-3 bacterium]|nr:acyl-CoA dehydratase activase [candidate division WOR-3 bacterium]